MKPPLGYLLLSRHLPSYFTQNDTEPLDSQKPPNAAALQLLTASDGPPNLLLFCKQTKAIKLPDRDTGKITSVWQFFSLVLLD